MGGRRADRHRHRLERIPVRFADPISSSKIRVENPTFVNDVVVTKKAAYFTDSINPEAVRGADRQAAASSATPRTLRLTGEMAYLPADSMPMASRPRRW